MQGALTNKVDLPAAHMVCLLQGNYSRMTGQFPSFDLLNLSFTIHHSELLFLINDWVTQYGQICNPHTLQSLFTQPNQAVGM